MYSDVDIFMPDLSHMRQARLWARLMMNYDMPVAEKFPGIVGPFELPGNETYSEILESFDLDALGRDLT